MTVTGCLPDYRIGFSWPIWIIIIILYLGIGTLFLINMKKTSFTNKRQLSLGGGMIFIGVGIAHLVIQIGVVLPEYFSILLALGVMLSFTLNLPLIYYWEENISKWKRVPTFLTLIIGLLSVFGFFLALATNEVIFTNILQFLALPVYLFLIGLTLKFIFNVIGDLRLRGISLLFGIILFFIGAALDHVPICTVFSFSTILSPIFFLVSIILYYWGFNGIANGLADYYQQAHICTIHKGEIETEKKMYICPSCYTSYCEKCYSLVVKNEGCWSCGYGEEMEEKDKKRQIEVKSNAIIVPDEEINKESKNKHKISK